MCGAVKEHLIHVQYASSDDKWQVSDWFIIVYIYIYIYIYTKSQKYIATLRIFLFLILNVLFLMKQDKPHNVFIYYTKYVSSSVTLT